MANAFYEESGRTFLQCKECGTFKEVNSDNWYKHPNGFPSVMGFSCNSTGWKYESDSNYDVNQ